MQIKQLKKDFKTFSHCSWTANANALLNIKLFKARALAF